MSASGSAARNALDGPGAPGVLGELLLVGEPLLAEPLPPAGLPPPAGPLLVGPPGVPGVLDALGGRLGGLGGPLGGSGVPGVPLDGPDGQRLDAAVSGAPRVFAGTGEARGFDGNGLSAEETGESDGVDGFDVPDGSDGT